MPLVTIIALCYNHAPFLRQALDSILAQDYPHLEVWLVDDASQDGSPEILREYAAANPTWHLLLLPQNLRNCRAFNQAFFQSKGEFIVDFATDDVLLPHRISQQVALFERLGPSYGVVYSNAELIDEQGQPQGLHHRPDGRGGLLPRPASGWVLADVLGRYFISSPTMLVRRAALARLGGYDEMLTFEDFDFWVRASPDWQFHYQDEITTQRRLHPRSMSTRAYQPNDPYLLSNIAVCRKAVALVRTPAERAAWASACAGSYCKPCATASGRPPATSPTYCMWPAGGTCWITCMDYWRGRGGACPRPALLELTILATPSLKPNDS